MSFSEFYQRSINEPEQLMRRAINALYLVR